MQFCLLEKDNADFPKKGLNVNDVYLLIKRNIMKKIK